MGAAQRTPFEFRHLFSLSLYPVLAAFQAEPSITKMNSLHAYLLWSKNVHQMWYTFNGHWLFISHEFAIHSDIRLKANDETIMELFWNSAFAFVSHFTTLNGRDRTSQQQFISIQCIRWLEIPINNNINEVLVVVVVVAHESNENKKMTMKTVCVSATAVPRNENKEKIKTKTRIDVLAGMITVLNVVYVCCVVSLFDRVCERVHTILRSIDVSLQCNAFQKLEMDCVNWTLKCELWLHFE